MKFILCLFFACSICAAEIKIVYTSALIPFKFEERKQEYIRSLKTIESYGYLPHTYVVESGGDSPLSFFEDYCNHVFFANSNNLKLVNKGVNESKAILKALDYYNFDDEDMIVKLTGRYYFNSDEFLKFLESHPEVDAAASRLHDPSRGITTGCFAMRGKFFKRMYKELDLVKMEEKLIDIEWEAEQFLKKMIAENAKVAYLDRVNITANVNNCEVVQW